MAVIGTRTDPEKHNDTTNVYIELLKSEYTQMHGGHISLD